MFPPLSLSFHVILFGYVTVWEAICPPPPLSLHTLHTHTPTHTHILKLSGDRTDRVLLGTPFAVATHAFQLHTSNSGPSRRSLRNTPEKWWNSENGYGAHEYGMSMDEPEDINQPQTKFLTFELKFN